MPQINLRPARNFVRNHGKQAFRYLISALEAQKSGAEIAAKLKVSRERVRQWKNMFGVTITTYLVHSEIKEMV
jgi:DNA-directed RNA polymerase specialized sigma subunit